MKQYRITSVDLVQDTPDDCFIPPDDPLHELKAASALGGLGGMERLMDYRAQQKTPVVSSNKGQLQREQGIKPGTDEWFKLWFGKNNK
jgi:hypothetical protein